MAESVRDALAELGKIAGKTTVEDLLDVIFRDFCIGK
jgi:tRNA modification GTPase